MKEPSLCRRHLWTLLLVACVCLFFGQTNAQAVPIAALADTNRLLLFDSERPEVIVSGVSITGLAAGEQIVAIDFRPLTGQIYALGNRSRLYIVNPATGAATQVGAMPFTPALGGVEFAARFDIDFDPVSDTLRVTSDGGQNLRLDPNSGAVVSVGGPLVFAATEPEAGRRPDITAIAYSNNFKDATASTLYGVDWRRGALVRIGSHDGAPISPDTGQTFIHTPIVSRFNVSSDLGFDIAANSGYAYLLLPPSVPFSNQGNFFTVNLSDGSLTQRGNIATGEPVRDITVVERAVDLLAVTVSNKLLRFNSGNPGALLNAVNITGLQAANEQVVGLNYQTARFVYVITNASRIYGLNVETGAAQHLGGYSQHPLNGTDFGLTSVPQGYSIAVSDADQNLTLSPYSPPGSTPLTPLAYASGDINHGQNPNVVGAAFTHDEGAAAAMFDIDSNLDILVRQGADNGNARSYETGQLFTVGSLGVNTTGLVGFDFARVPLLIPCNSTALRTGTPFASLTAPGDAASKLYAIDVKTGAASLRGTIGGGELVRALGVVPTVGVFGFSSPSGYYGYEDIGRFPVTITRSGETSVAASVDYETFDGTAKQSHDYTNASGTLHFAPGETAKTILILITDDAITPEGHEAFGQNFSVRLSNPTGGFGLGHVPGYLEYLGAGATEVRILDNDADAPATNPIDATDFFVRQHYRDFLDREPDDAGLAFWTNEIASCGANSACVERKRISVSAAFFLSIEFQQTGFFVQRLYQASFNRDPRYNEFMHDKQRVARGVVVGESGWESRLELNLQAFLNEWVNCKTFKDAFDAKTNAEYIDALFANAGVVPAASERQSLIDGLDHRTVTRASALRLIVEHQAFKRQEFNPAFVLAEYFGYLRRNPSDPPDNNMNGYNFWLAKLNSFGGDFINAEMVKAFISSGEYRGRFFQEQPPTNGDALDF